jgi:hypothetical protein
MNRSKLPKSIIALGLVSLFMDTLIRDDPQSAAGVPGHRAGRERLVGRLDRGHRRSHGIDRQGVFRGDFRLDGAQKTSGAARLWAWRR